MQLNTLLSFLAQPFTTLEYYTRLGAITTQKRILALSAVVILCATVAGAYFIYTDLPVFLNSLSKTLNTGLMHYPEELVFTFTQSRLTANTDTLLLPLPEEFFPQENRDTQVGLPQNFAAYQNTQQTPQELLVAPNEYFFFVTQLGIYTNPNSDESGWRFYSFADLIETNTSAVFTKADAGSLVNGILEYLDTNQLEIMLVCFTAFFVLFVFSKIWFLFIESIFLLLVFKLCSLAQTAQQTVLLATQIMIPTLVLGTVATLLYGPLFFSFETLVFWVLVVYIGSALPRKKLN